MCVDGHGEARQCGAGGAGLVPWAGLLQLWRGSQQLTCPLAPAAAQHTRPLSSSLYHGNTSQPPATSSLAHSIIVCSAEADQIPASL